MDSSIHKGAVLMSLLAINADLPNFDAILDAVERGQKGELRHTREAVRAVTTDLIQRTWIQYASGATVTYGGGTFRIKSISGDYVRSIQDGLRFLDDFTGEVFTTIPYASTIEDGIKPFDMKSKMLQSNKAKIGKDGKRFITVPFRHGTPGASTMPAMPSAVHSQAKSLGYSRRNNIIKAFFTGRKYTWNGRLKADPQGQRSHVAPHSGAGYTWKTGQFSGMVKMGKGNHTQYLTFRRVSENSDPQSWHHPGVKPRPIREAVIENTRDEALQLIRRGFEMDLYFMGIGGE